MSNWGRWGGEDERGAANLADADATRAAAELVRTGRVLNLGIEVKGTGVPAYPGRPTPLHSMFLDGGDFAAGVKLPEGFKMADDFVALGCHSTTHVDALAHVWYDDALYNGHDPNRVRSYGATRCGIEKLGGMVTRGVLVDVPRLKGVDHLEGGYAITPSDVDEALALAGVSVQPGDCVLVRTGWWRMYASDPEEYHRWAPGLNDAAGRNLAAQDVWALGADTMAFEVQTGPGTFEGGARSPVAHRALIRDFGVYIFELLDLEELSAAKVGAFMFIVAPLRLAGGTASPVNPLAVL